MTSRIPVGDSHNFGRRVSVSGGRVHKPRAILWEWLVLGADSPIRKVLREIAEQDGLGRKAFGFLPELKFFPSQAPDGGAVERIALEPLPAPSGPQRMALAAIVGRSLALFSWLGISDLHWENLVLGVGDHGEIIFAPLDIEMILGELARPTQTKLLPDADPEVAAICRHACGVRRVLPYLGKPVAAATLMAMASAYTTTLALLDRHARRVADVLAGLGALRETPIRVCLRGTDEYIHARSEPVWPPLLDAEAEQLARGDVPYFFRLYGRPGIHYYGNPALTLVKRIPMRGDVPQLDPVLHVSRGLRSPLRKKLREEGLFALLGAFDHRSIDGRHEVDGIAVTFRAQSLVVELPTGVHLRSRRNLSAFVGSVYSPCRCGEVRSVFVPPVTVCNAFS